MSIFQQIGLALAQFRAFTAVLRELRHESDGRLAARDIDRGDVVRVAYEEAERLVRPEPKRPKSGGKRVSHHAAVWFPGGNVAAH